MNLNNQQQKNSISDKILNKIRSGEVKMRPKIYFILRAVLIVLGVVAVALFALFLISFINFNLRASGSWFLPGFGFRGLGIFFSSLPWLLILIAVLLIIVLEVLVKQFSFAYRRPILYSILGIILLVFLGSFIIGKTQVHPGFFWRAQEGKLPVAGQFYRGYGISRLHGAHTGVVSELTDNGFRIETNDGQILTVVIAPKTRFPFGISVKENDTVMVLGERDNDTIQAFGIRKITDDLKVFPRNRPDQRLRR